ncbi:hypothetical protein BG011_002786, partial [Mortierella polycephala]
MMLKTIANQPGFMGWEAALVQELALKQNWRRGRYVYEMTITLTRNIKPTLLAWPMLILVDDWPRVYKISLETLRRDRYQVIPIGNERYSKVMELQGHGTVSCIAWDNSCAGTSALEEEDEEDMSLPLALGGYMRSVRICDPDTKSSVALPDVHHGFPLHVCFLRDQILSVTLDGQVTFFQKGNDYRPIRLCTVGTKVYQVVAVNFGTRTFERQDQDGTTISWGEVICLAHEYGVIIKDEYAHTLCEIHVDLGATLLQIQAIADDSPPYRNELLILFEDPNTRQRRVLCVKMAPGFEEEMDRKVLNPGFSLGRGGDARDSIAMYRDRIGI